MVDTDYTTYAVVYSCVEKGSKADVNVWILARESTIDSTTLTYVEDVVST